MRSFFICSGITAAMLPVESLMGQGAGGNRTGWRTYLSGTSAAGNHRSRSCRRRLAARRMDHSLGAKGESLDRLPGERPDFLHQFVQETVPDRRSDPMYFPAAALRRIRCTARRAAPER